MSCQRVRAMFRIACLSAAWMVASGVSIAWAQEDYVRPDIDIPDATIPDMPDVMPGVMPGVVDIPEFEMPEFIDPGLYDAPDVFIDPTLSMPQNLMYNNPAMNNPALINAAIPPPLPPTIAQSINGTYTGVVGKLDPTVSQMYEEPQIAVHVPQSYEGKMIENIYSNDFKAIQDPGQLISEASHNIKTFEQKIIEQQPWASTAVAPIADISQQGEIYRADTLKALPSEAPIWALAPPPQPITDDRGRRP